MTELSRQAQTLTASCGLVDRYEALSAADRASFERLLDCRNEDLMVWLINGDSPPDEQLAGIVNRIRADGAQTARQQVLATPRRRS